MTKTKKTRAPPRPSPRPKTKTHKARLRHLISQRNPFSRTVSQQDKNEIKRLLKETQAKESKAVLKACCFLAGIFGMAGVLGMISSGGGLVVVALGMGLVLLLGLKVRAWRLGKKTVLL